MSYKGYDANTVEQLGKASKTRVTENVQIVGVGEGGVPHFREFFPLVFTPLAEKFRELDF